LFRNKKERASAPGAAARARSPPTRPQVEYPFQKRGRADRLAQMALAAESLYAKNIDLCLRQRQFLASHTNIDTHIWVRRRAPGPRGGPWRALAEARSFCERKKKRLGPHKCHYSLRRWMSEMCVGRHLRGASHGSERCAPPKRAVSASENRCQNGEGRGGPHPLCLLHI
jgi:hypothetical protein